VVAVNRDYADFRIIHCNDANCAGGDENSNDISAPGRGGEDLSLQLDSSGYPVIAYTEATYQCALYLTHCNDVNCAGNDETTNEIENWYPNPPGSSSLQLDSSGYPASYCLL